MKNYITVFDHNFLPQGLCLHSSLMRVLPDAHLWICALDNVVETQLRSLQLPNTDVLSLVAVEREFPELLTVKSSRSAREYCWTLSPFLPEAVLRFSPSVDDITYVDADLFFLSSPVTISSELQESGRKVLITRHSYDPAYDQTSVSGEFCVQYLTFLRSPEALDVLHWWQARVIEWCYATPEEGKLGDQRYLEAWPALFPSSVHVLRDGALTLAPWNVRYHVGRASRVKPVFFHFQDFRIESRRKARLHTSYYSVGELGRQYYALYLAELKKVKVALQSRGIPLATIPSGEGMRLLRFVKRVLTGTRHAYGRI